MTKAGDGDFEIPARRAIQLRPARKRWVELGDDKVPEGRLRFSAYFAGTAVFELSPGQWT